MLICKKIKQITNIKQGSECVLTATPSVAPAGATLGGERGPLPEAIKTRGRRTK